MSDTVERTVTAPGGAVTYRLERKRVKNLNLRVRRDGSVYVSASPRVSLRAIDGFVAARADFIAQAQARMARERSRAAAQPPVEREACLALFTGAVARLLPLLTEYGVAMPQVKVRAMKSRWGSCAWKKGTLTLNSRLYHAPGACLDYVVLHELCHFVHPDHSPAFHRLMSALMPDYKARKAALERWSGG